VERRCCDGACAVCAAYIQAHFSGPASWQLRAARDDFHETISKALTSILRHKSPGVEFQLNALHCRVSDRVRCTPDDVLYLLENMKKRRGRIVKARLVAKMTDGAQYWSLNGV
jgi:hypothetical protein